MSNLNHKQFSIPAIQIQPGDRLDPAGKVRVHAARMIGKRFTVAHKTRGSKSPGMSDYDPDQIVRIWRKG